MSRFPRCLNIFSPWAMLLTIAMSSPALAADKPEFTAAPPPSGTKISASFGTEKNGGPEVLLDGDEKTFMQAQANTANGPASLFLRFPKPLTTLAGIRTGKSDPYHNYFPQQMRFYVDTNGDGAYDTYVGQTEKLGPADQSIGDHLFETKPAVAHGLEVRVTKQSKKGVGRAFTLNELGLLYSEETWGGKIEEPVEPGQARPVNISPNVETPLTVFDPARQPRMNLIKGGEYKQSLNFVDAPERGKVMRLHWHEDGSNGFAEMLVNDRPSLHAFAKGVLLRLEVNGEAAAGLDFVGVRIVDAKGEVFQWGGKVDPNQKGWQTVNIVLDPARHGGSWGGPNEGKGIIDEPVKLLAITSGVPKGFRAPATLLIGNVKRNAFAAEDIAPLALLNAVEMKLKLPLKTPVITKGQEDVPVLTLENKGDFAVAFNVRLDITDAFGAKTSVTLPDALSLKAKERIELPAKLPLKTFGWFTIVGVLTAKDKDKDVTAQQLDTAMVYIDPVGMRPPTPEDFQFAIGGTLHDDDTAAMGAMVGVDWDRGGGPSKNESLTERPKGEWLNFQQVDRALALAEKHGIAYQMLIGYLPRWAAREGYFEKYKPQGWQVSTLAPRGDVFREYMRTITQRYKGRIHSYEIFNEPDLDGFFKGTTDDYLELLKIAHEEIKAAAPTTLVGTGGFATVRPHGGHHLNPDLMARVMTDGQPYFDIHIHHEHGDFNGFSQAVDGPLTKLRSRLTESRPIYYNETAVPASPDKYLWQAGELAKKIAYAKASGGKGYAWFLMMSRDPGLQGWAMFELHTYRPKPIFPAFNEVVRQLRNKKTLSTPDLGGGRFALAFAGADEITYLVWREDNDVSDALVSLEVPQGASAKVVDLMGNASDLTVKAGRAIVKTDAVPVYLVVSGIGQRQATLRPVLTFSGRVTDDAGENVELQARGAAAGADHTVTLKAQKPSVKPDAMMELKLASAADLQQAWTVQPATPTDRLNLAMEVDGCALGILHVPVMRSIIIPASATGEALMQRKPDFVLERENQVVNFFQNDPTSEHRTWKGAADLSAKIWLAHDAAELRLHVEVTDNKHHQPKPDAGIWDADSIQFGLAVPGQAGFWELGVARHDSGRTTVANWVTPGGTPEIVKSVKADVTPKGNTLVYDVRIPLEALGIKVSELVTGVRFNLIVNDSDGQGRNGYIQIAPGIGAGKNTQQFPMIRFAPQQPQ